MKDRRGNPIKHFTPFRTPESSGVNIFAGKIGKDENCYVHPPFTIINPVVNFIVENHLQCTLVVPAVDITPVWLPSVQSSIEDALVVGYKGQKHALKYPSKKGFVNDKYGLRSNLWAIRLGPEEYPYTYGKLLFATCPGVNLNSHLLICGDSMVRSAEGRSEFSSPLVQISARGGALIHEAQHDLEMSVKRYPPKAIFFQAGVNNMSKTYLYRNEYQQITSALDQINQLEQGLKMYPMVYLGVKIVLSAIIATKDGFINARSDIVNEKIRLCCQRNNWTYMNNDNVTTDMLRDSVHLDSQGEDIFVHNIMTILSQVLA